MADGREPQSMPLDAMLRLEGECHPDYGEEKNHRICLEGHADDEGFQAEDSMDLGEASSPIRHTNGGQSRKFDRVDNPLRVEPPPSFNAPARSVEQTQEQHIKASAFSPAAFTMRKYDLRSYGLGAQDYGGGVVDKEPSGSGSRQRQDLSGRGHSENQASHRNAMRDYSMLAFSSQRSGRHEMEGLALYSAGVMMDSIGQHGKALESYRKFLPVCRALKNSFMEGVCHNCMGVDYMLMACPPGSQIQEKGKNLSARAVSCLTKALQHHEAHLQVADDVGSGVAHSNMGLCHDFLGNHATAAKQHQEALRIAVRVQSAGAQSVAVGNLATLAIRQGDSETAAACLEQHLQLVQQLGDWQGEINAWSKMAQLAATNSSEGGSGSGHCNSGGEGAQGRALDAVTRSLMCYERAAALAKAHNEVSTLKRLHCDMGIVRGNATMEEYFKRLHDVAAD